MQDLGAGPSEQWFYDVIVFSQPCYMTMVERRYRASARELRKLANVRQKKKFIASYNVIVII